MTLPFATIEEAVKALQEGRMIVLMDDEQRENEGDLVIAAEKITPEAINFMTHHARGLICLSMAPTLLDRLQLPMMTEKNRAPYQTAFTVSIEAATGVSTGISAKDRARTILVAIDPDTTAEDLVSPGHIFPVRAREGGVLVRGGQTEGSVDLAKIANLIPAAVICEIMNEDGSMSRLPELSIFAKQHAIPLVRMQDLIDYRIRQEILVELAATSMLPLHEYGEFTFMLFSNPLDGAEHFALVKKPTTSNQVPLVRVHSECITGDVLGSSKCDCGHQLHLSLSLLSQEGGVLIYLRQEGRGVGLLNKMKAYALQEKGLDTVDANLELGLPADNRNYLFAYQILKYLGIDAIRLLTNNPQKIEELQRYGLHIAERVPLEVTPSATNQEYLKTKKQKLGHLLSIS